MSLTKHQKKVVNDALLVLAESRLKTEHDMHDATVLSIKKRDLCRSLESAYIELSTLLKPRDIKKAVQEIKEKLDETDCVKK